MFDLSAVQGAIRELGLDGWLLYDFRGMNVLARRVLGLNPEHILSRRWFYFVPAQGEPRKLVHRIEAGALDADPGGKQVYLRWRNWRPAAATSSGGRSASRRRTCRATPTRTSRAATPAT